MNQCFGHMGCVVNQEKFAQYIRKGAVSKPMYSKGGAGLEKIKNHWSTVVSLVVIVGFRIVDPIYVQQNL